MQAGSRCKTGTSPAHRCPASAWFRTGRVRTRAIVDPLRSASNRAKHVVDFDQALELWQDPHAHRGARTRGASGVIRQSIIKVWITERLIQAAGCQSRYTSHSENSRSLPGGPFPAWRILPP